MTALKIRAHPHDHTIPTFDDRFLKCRHCDSVWRVPDRPTPAQMRSHPVRPTVADSIVADLRAAGWEGVCGAEWYASFRPTFSQRISIDLKARGFVIASWPCTDHDHRGSIHRYRLVVDPERVVPKGEPG